MRAIRFRAFILTPLLVALTGRCAAGVTRVPLLPGRRQSVCDRQGSGTSNSEQEIPRILPIRGSLRTAVREERVSAKADTA